jgi:signal transduction histidine kinase
MLLAIALISLGVLLYSAYSFAHEQARRQTMDTARAMARVVDGEFARHEALLRALSQSPSVAHEDWAAVDREARSAFYSADAWVVVGDRFGHQLVNTRLPADAKLPKGPDPKWIWPVLDQGRTRICDLTHGLIEPNILCVDVPIMRGGGAAYYMSVIMRPHAMQPVFSRQRFPPGWYGAILDTTATMVWRNRDADKFVGHKATPAMIAAIHREREGVEPLTSLDGVETYAAFSRSPVSGWTFVVAAPRRQLDGGLWVAFFGGLVVVFALLVIGGAVALRWTRQATLGVEKLASGAAALGRREPFELPPTGTLEIDAIALALANADEALRRRDEEVERLNASLEERVRTAIGERETALAQLHEAQKLETLGQLTGGVAHDFNNLLAPIMGSLDLLQVRHGAEPRSKRLIDAAMASTERAKTLVARLLSFARRQALQPRAVDVPALVHGMSDLVQRSLGSAIAVRIDAAPGVAPAHVDPNQLELAILNLAINARDAMPEGGTLTLGVAEEQLAADNDHGVAPGTYVHVSVADTGQGMDAATLRRAIEPFFTTKAQGRGTGLGLSMVHGLAAQSGGAFALDSAPGAGTRASLWLPRSSAKVAELRPAAITRPPVGGRGHVLVVDDEDMVRMGTTELLMEMGYRVSQASSGAQALDLLDRERFDILVSDYLMPGMNGAMLTSEVRERAPMMPIVLVTGYASADLDLAAGVAMLAKPFRQRDLAASIDQATGALTHGTA